MRSVITLTAVFLLVASPALAQVLNPVDERQSVFMTEVMPSEMVDADLEGKQPVVRLANGDYATPSRGEGPELVIGIYCGIDPDSQLFIICPAPSYDFGTVAPGGLGPFHTQRLMDGQGGIIPYLMLFNLSETDAATNLSVEIGPDPQFQGFPSPFVANEACHRFNVLPPGQWCRLFVRFAPTEAGPTEGTLTISSAHGVEATTTLHGIGGEDSLLHGQFYQWDPWPEDANAAFLSWVIGRYITTPDLDADMADDFLVEHPDGWTITTVGFGYGDMTVAMSIPVFEVYIIEDDNGYPGENVVCSALEPPVVWRDHYENRVEIALPEPCVLPPGHYWFSARPVAIDGTMYTGLWAVHHPWIHPPGGSEMHLLPQVWKNPSGWFGKGGCLDWTYLVFGGPCTSGYDPHGAIFWLIGQEGKIITNEPSAEAHTGVLTAPSPNPVRERATFELTVDRGQQVTVEVFDLMGRRVQVLFEGGLAAGATENLSFDASRLPSGVYVIRALGEDFVDTRRVTVVH